MDDHNLIADLQREIRALEEENTALRAPPKPPPATTARHEVERLVFQIAELRTQVQRCERQLRAYQSRIRSLTEDFYRRHGPGSP